MFLQQAHALQEFGRAPPSRLNLNQTGHSMSHKGTFFILSALEHFIWAPKMRSNVDFKAKCYSKPLVLGMKTSQYRF